MEYKKKRIILVLIIVLIVSIFYTLSNISLIDIVKLPKNVYGQYDDLEYFNSNNEFGKFISFDYDDTIQTSTNDSVKVKIKLFNIFTLKEINVNLDREELYVPGKAIGFNLFSDGLIIIGSNKISSEEGEIDLLNNSPLKIGDKLISINGKMVENSLDIETIINLDENKQKPIVVVVDRNDEKLTFEINPILDKNTQTYKLGLWVKDSTNGVGTLTYIKKDDLRFGALGHPITDSNTKEIFDIKSGLIYDCNVIGVTKGHKGKPGELKGLFLEGKNEQGVVDKNQKYGVYGKILKDSTFLSGNTLEAGGRFSSRPGKAKIRTCIDGMVAKDYDIEIIKTNYQSTSNNKSMVIKVVDKELLNKTGGIVQGMSGSPIIQNGKVIGAVTHVFVSDPTKGFGIYLDWMLKE